LVGAAATPVTYRIFGRSSSLQVRRSKSEGFGKA